MELRKHYRDDLALRQSFNALAEATFGLNFETWYRNGFWGDAYDPYSMVEDGRVVANVSVNRTNLMVEGQRKRLIQLGTVMTDPSFRNRGLIRRLMAEVERDCGEADGIYLFADDSVLDFYPRFGFRRGTEYVCSRRVEQSGSCEMVRMPMETPEQWAALAEAMGRSGFAGGVDMVDNPGLIFFYVSQSMRDCVFFCRLLDAWVVAEQEGDTLTLYNIFAPGNVTVEDCVAAFGIGVRRVILGFSPVDADGYAQTLLREEDTTLFVKGTFFEEFEQKKLRIPGLAHA